MSGVTQEKSNGYRCIVLVDYVHSSAFLLHIYRHAHGEAENISRSDRNQLDGLVDEYGALSGAIQAEEKAIKTGKPFGKRFIMIDINKLLGSKRVEVSFPETAVDGAYVKLFRADHRLTQAALANIMGVKKKTIEKWEQGVNKVSGSSAVLLKLLRDDPELIGRLYKVQAVSGKTETDDYTPIDRKGDQRNSEDGGKGPEKHLGGRF